MCLCVHVQNLKTEKEEMITISSEGESNIIEILFDICMHSWTAETEFNMAYLPILRASCLFVWMLL